ncbi:MAG TPA: ABC transporter substrate-binding protein [Vicinamibacteria bacterium]
MLAVKGDITGVYPSAGALNEAFTTQVHWNFLEGLVGLDSQLHMRPALAVHWSNPDDHTYVFELRPGLVFSDGRPLRAHDVVASLRGASRTALADYFHAIAEARTLNDQRLQVVTRSPYLVLLTRLPWGMVLPEAEWDRPEPAPIGTGPFKFVSRDPGREIVLDANPRHRGSAPAFGRVVYRVVPNDEQRMELVLSGQADAADQLPLAMASDLAGDARARPVSGEGLRVIYLGLRPTRPPFDDPRVREAIDLAIDRREILARVFAGRGRVASQIVPETVAGFDPGIEASRPDPERARRLLEAAGVKGAIPLELHGPNNRYLHDTAVLEEIARQLRQVGLTVSIRAMDKTAFFSLAGSGGTQMHLMGWSCETADAGDALDALAHSKDATGIGSDNDLDLSDLELDRLIEAANASTSAEDRVRRLQAALRRFHQQKVYLPLYVQPESVLVSSRLAFAPAPNFALVPWALRPLPGGQAS